MTREEREVLKKMSLDAYGKSSYWQKFLNKPILIQKQGSTIKTTSYRTLDEVKEILDNALKEKQAKRDAEVLKASEKVMEDHKETFEKLRENELEDAIKLNQANFGNTEELEAVKQTLVDEAQKLNLGYENV